MKTIVIKLPYKLQDKWQTKAQGKLEERNSKITITDFVQFIEKQAKICSNAILRDLQESVISRNKRSNASKSLSRPKSSNANNVATLSTPVAPSMNSDVKPACLCCDGAHSLEHCSDFKKKTHREKLNLFKGKRTMPWLFV